MHFLITLFLCSTFRNLSGCDLNSTSPTKNKEVWSNEFKNIDSMEMAVGAVTGAVYTVTSDTTDGLIYVTRFNTVKQIAWAKSFPYDSDSM